MPSLIDLSAEEAKKFFLKGTSYFDADLPTYISFEELLKKVDAEVGDKPFHDIKTSRPDKLYDVNYTIQTNKDGRFAWRAFELIHPVIYVLMVREICSPENWPMICAKLEAKTNSLVECCSLPIVSSTDQSDKAEQILSWWQKVEQASIAMSLEYTHLLHSDVADCYGSIYTHTIPWSLYGKEEAKRNRGDQDLVGNQIDFLLRQCRSGQTNGIPQGSALMHLLAELVLCYCDEQIYSKFSSRTDFKIIRYRDDYRIFSNSDEVCEDVLLAISDVLRDVGMRLSPSKTYVASNVVLGSIKKDKIAALGLLDGKVEAETVQKQLLALHAFGQNYPNSGSLKKLLYIFFEKVSQQTAAPSDLDVQVAIATDIAVSSPNTIPVIAGILAHLISLADEGSKDILWERVKSRLGRVPNNGFLEIWLQRVVHPIGIDTEFSEAICSIVKSEPAGLWNNSWISNSAILKSLSTETLLVKKPQEMPATIKKEEIALFKERAWQY